MPARRRFHGYCPPMARKISNMVVVSSKDDYTTTLNSLAVNRAAPKDMVLTIPAVFSRMEATRTNLDKGNSNCFPLRQDLDEDNFFDDGDIMSTQLSPVYRTRSQNQSSNDGFVTSLSQDSRDEIQAFTCRQNIIEARQISKVELNLDKMASYQHEEGNEIDAIYRTVPISQLSETSSVEESLFVETFDTLVAKGDVPKKPTEAEFWSFRLNYLIVICAIMLADGLQGTHLYVLYEGYGYSVSSLYCLGFLTGAVTSPITGALVDRLGRKKAALLYCALEMGINMMEQYPNIVGLIICRMIGGITTNLLSSVFETWLDTEYRRRGFDNLKYEIIMRDSVVVSNLAAIASGYLAHHLATRFGPVGPFEGAVTCTALALAVVACLWTENYGTVEAENIRSISGYLYDAVQTFKNDSKALRVGIIQGLTTGSIQIFIFLWSPVLRQFAQNAPANVLGLDDHGEPAYGLIFGAFMACGVLGGLVAPIIRRGVTELISTEAKATTGTVMVEGEVIRPMAVELLATACYLVCAGLLLVPYFMSNTGAFSFSLSLLSFLVYEFIVGIYMPCEGVIRSLYIPSDSRCSLMMFPRIIVNIAVSIGVISTNFVSLASALCAVSCLMITSAILQLSLVSSREWDVLFGRVDRWKGSAARSLSYSTFSFKPKRRDVRRSKSTPTALSSFNKNDDQEKKGR